MSKLQHVLKRNTQIEKANYKIIYEYAQQDSFYIDPLLIREKIDTDWITTDQKMALTKLEGKTFVYKWKFSSELMKNSVEWKYKPETLANKLYNKDLKSKYDYVYNTFRVKNKYENE